VEDIIYQPGTKERRYQVEGNTKGQSDCKTFDWPCAEKKKGQGCNKGGYLGVDDCPECFIKATFYPGLYRFAYGKFLAHAFENKNIGIHSHADG
jgi:hypothetical protein